LRLRRVAIGSLPQFAPSNPALRSTSDGCGRRISCLPTPEGGTDGERDRLSPWGKRASQAGAWGLGPRLASLLVPLAERLRREQNTVPTATGDYPGREAGSFPYELRSLIVPSWLWIRWSVLSC
jgi:hypothetical protein